MSGRYCGSSAAFANCRFAGTEQPTCAATEVAHGRCEYRHRGFGRPQVGAAGGNVVTCMIHETSKEKRAADLFGVVDPFGVTHIITDDGNVEDRHIAFVEKEMQTCDPPPTEAEQELISLLKAMPVEVRKRDWGATE